MANQWFRMYGEVLDDPKVQRLPPENFRHWVNVLCIASRHTDGILPDIHDIAFMLRIDEVKASSILQTLELAGLLDSTDYGYRPHNWDGRQYKSDSSADRVKRYRQRKTEADVTLPDRYSNDDVTLHVTHQIQNRTDTEQNREREHAQQLDLDHAKRSRFVPEAFEPNELFHATHRHRNPAANYHLELAKFKAHEFAMPKSDWQRAWISWWIKAKADTNDTRNSLERQTDELLQIDRRYL